MFFFKKFSRDFKFARTAANQKRSYTKYYITL